MKHSVLYIRARVTRMALCALLAAAPIAGFAQADDEPDQSEAMAANKADAVTWQETDSRVSSDRTETKTPYLSARRALVGRHCSVNRVINVVAVGTGTSGLENLTNEDIDDYATFPSVVSATVVTSPTVSVRDMRDYYAAGTTAGFCIVAGSGSSVLSLDLIKTYHIWFYCDGKLVDDQTVREANSGSGVKLTLIGIPGSQQTCANLTAVSSQKFDEVALVQGGAVNAEVGKLVMIKYAFVGDAHDVHLTVKGVHDYCEKSGHEDMSVSCEAFMPSPLVGGIPIPMTSGAERDVIGTAENEMLDEKCTLVSAVQLASVAFKGRVRVNVKNDYATSELFKAGDQVGFKFGFVQVADVLNVGTWIDIALYNRKGEKVQTTTISADVLSLSVASGGDQTSYIVAGEDFSGAEITFYSALGVLNLGDGYGVYYGFVRPKPVVEHECMLNPMMDTNICDNQTTHKLKSNPAINVKWEAYRWPSYPSEEGKPTVDDEGFVSGMNDTGPYVFKVTSLDDEGDNPCVDYVTINRGQEADFTALTKETALTGDEYDFAFDLHGQTSANILSISNIENAENILDGDLTNYATYTGGLQLAGANGIIMGIKKKDGYLYEGSKADALDAVRIGFVVEMQQTNIGLSLLDAFQIRCFDAEGNRIYSSIVENAGVLGVNLIGSNANSEDGTDKSNKIRICITVPKASKDGTLDVKEIQLWKIGTLNLDVNDIKFYYAFMDDPSDPANNQIIDGADIVTYKNYGAIVNMGTQVEVAAVGCVTTNLSNIVDIDPLLQSYALLQKTANAGTQRIIVKLGRTVDFRHQVGVVVDNDIIALNANVGEVMKVETYHNGKATGESSTNWGVLGANVISGSGQTVLYLQPKSDFDEIQIVAGGGLEVNKTLKIYGILLRNDIDADGIADNRDTQSCPDDVASEFKTPSVCVGGTIAFQCKVNSAGQRYYVSFPDHGVEMQQLESSHDDSRLITYDIVTKKAGRFTAYVYNGEQQLIGTTEYMVHPLQTTWRANTLSQDWNDWDNWTEGSPYLCTNVIIPSDARVYPSLDKVLNEQGEEDADEYGCRGIHFESGAAVEKVYRLNYERAWVDFAPQAGRWYMLSAPLKSVYTGDFFVAAADQDTITSGGYFMTLASEGDAVNMVAAYPENRFAPRFYQRVWETATDFRLANGENSPAAATVANWSRRFNVLKKLYGLGEGFSLYADAEEREGTLTVRLPKAYDTYYYYYEGTQEKSKWNETGLTRDGAHRFVYEDEALRSHQYTYETENDRSVFNKAAALTLTLSSTLATTTYLVGNPFMSHISVKDFIEANPSVASVQVHNGASTTALVSVDGELLATADGADFIAPMQAFFVTLNSATNSLTLNFNDDMFRMTAAEDDAAPTRPLMRIKARAAGTEAAALLVGDDVVPQAETIVDEEATPALAVFTLMGDRACDIRALRDEREVVLGVISRSDTVQLSFDALGGFDLQGYRLLDRNTGLTYMLDALPAFTGLKGTCIGRFVLVNTEPTDIAAAPQADGLEITVSDERISVFSPSNDITRVSAYTADGRLIARSGAGSNADLRLRPGVCLVTVERAGQRAKTYRVLVR